MKHQYLIQQILYNWKLTLPIEDQTGESIVTTDDINRLNQELISIFDGVTPFHWIIKMIRAIKKYFNVLLTKILQRKTSANLLRPL